MRATPRGRQYTLLLIGDGASSIRKVQVPERRIRTAAALLAAVALLGAGLFAHYASMLVGRGTARTDARVVREENDRLRAQLRAVEDRVTHITATLDRVAQFDASLRGTVKQLQGGTPRGPLPASSAPPGAGIGGPAVETPAVGGPAVEPRPADGRATKAPAGGAAPGSRGTGRGVGAPDARGGGASAPQSRVVGGPVSQRPDLAARLASLDEAASAQEASLRTISDYFEAQHALLATTPTAWPARGWVSSDFGDRLDPYTAERMMHRGLDIATPPGYPVLAPSDGTVTFAGTEDGYGKVLILDHGHGVNTRYGHLSAIYVKSGQHVKRGARVGAVGNTGRSTGPHLHYEVRVNGVAENPRKFLLE